MDWLVRAVPRWRCEMPLRGRQLNLSDAEIRNAIIYMATPTSGRDAGTPRHIRLAE